MSIYNQDRSAKRYFISWHSRRFAWISLGGHFGGSFLLIGDIGLRLVNLFAALREGNVILWNRFKVTWWCRQRQWANSRHSTAIPIRTFVLRASPKEVFDWARGPLRDMALNGYDKIRTIVNLCSDPLCQWYHFWHEVMMKDDKGKFTLEIRIFLWFACSNKPHRGLSNSTTTAICTDGAVKGIGNAQSLSKSQVQTRAIEKFLDNGYTKSDIMVGHSRDSTVLQVVHSW